MSSESGLAAEVAALRRRVERLEEQLGAPPPPPAVPAPAPPPDAASTMAPPLPPVPATARSEGKGGPLVVAAAGAAIFILGAGFFLRVAFQRGWIGPAARFALGLIVGGLLAAVAVRLLRRGSRALAAWVLLAGLGTLELTLWAGAFRYGFLSPLAGLATCAGLCLTGGLLAARAQAPGGLLAAFAAAYIAPIVFSERSGDFLALSAFHALLAALIVAAAYVAPLAPRWWALRWVVLVALGAAQVAVAAGAPAADLSLCYALFAAEVLLAVLWIWLPGHRSAERPSTAAFLWTAFVCGAAPLAGAFWRRTELRWEAFALPLLLVAAGHVLAAPWARRRSGDRVAEPALLAIAAALVAAAVFVGLESRWEAPALALVAVGLALHAGRGFSPGEPGTPDRRPIWMWLGLGFGFLATLGWMRAVAPSVIGLETTTPAGSAFLNENFAAAILTVLAGVLLVRGPRGEATSVPSGAAVGAALALIGIEALAPSALAVELHHGLRPTLGRFAASTAVTVLWALVGAAQWLRSLAAGSGELRTGRGVRQALFAGGYFWLGVAAAKLVFYDLVGIDLLWRALVFLAVGAIFLGAALYAHGRGSRR